MTNDDIIRMAKEAGLYTKCEVHSAVPFDQLLTSFAALIAAAVMPKEALAEMFEWGKDAGRREEREACASLEVEVIVPTKDYSSMTPLDCYEAALMDQAIAFRKAIRARGQS